MPNFEQFNYLLLFATCNAMAGVYIICRESLPSKIFICLIVSILTMLHCSFNPLLVKDTPINVLIWIAMIVSTIYGYMNIYKNQDDIGGENV